MSAIGPKSKILDFFGDVVFEIRWLLVPFYLFLYVALGIYVWCYMREIWEMLAGAGGLTSEHAMLTILRLIDMGMIANLVTTNAIGGWTIFVREYRYKELTDQPRWLSPNFSSMEQKTKLFASLTAVAGIKFLHEFITVSNLSWDTLGKMIAIIGVFLIVMLTFCWVQLRTHRPSEHAN